jgi:hypothetical protein
LNAELAKRAEIDATGRSVFVSFANAFVLFVIKLFLSAGFAGSAFKIRRSSLRRSITGRDRPPHGTPG